jgi:hydroxymethylpyrimidine pyrophosphatase-like HAD family hydrolase
MKECFVIDIDNTILFAKISACDECARPVYHFGTASKKEIALINKAFRKGHRIVMYTGRGWDQYEITVSQLEKAKVKYHELVMGKPIGIYIDKDAHMSMEGLI